MRAALTIGYYSDGSPVLLSDTRTPAETQRKQMAMIKHGGELPSVEVVRIELWDGDQGIVERWQAAATPKPESTKTTKSKSK